MPCLRRWINPRADAPTSAQIIFLLWYSFSPLFTNFAGPGGTAMPFPRQGQPAVHLAFGHAASPSSQMPQTQVPISFPNSLCLDDDMNSNKGPGSHEHFPPCRAIIDFLFPFLPTVLMNKTASPDKKREELPKAVRDSQKACDDCNESMRIHSEDVATLQHQ